LRLKQNISPFVDGLSVIKQINPVNYELNGLAGTPLGAKGVGVIAQDIKDVAPYTVSTFKTKLNPTDTQDTELYSFNSSDLTFVMINAIKELASSSYNQQAEIDVLKSQLASISLSFNSQGGIGDLPKPLLIDQIKQILADIGIIIENGVAKIQKIIAGFIQTGGLEVGSKETPTGFVLYDETTKEPYCVSINNGEIVKTIGKCGEDRGSTQIEPAPQDTQINADGETIPSESAPIIEENPIPPTEITTSTSEEIVPAPTEIPVVEPITEPTIEPVVEPIIP